MVIVVIALAAACVGLVWYAIPRVEAYRCDQNRRVAQAIHEAGRDVMFTDSALDALLARYETDFRAALADIPADRIAALYQAEEA